MKKIPEVLLTKDVSGFLSVLDSVPATLRREDYGMPQLSSGFGYEAEEEEREPEVVSYARRNIIEKVTEGVYLLKVKGHLTDYFQWWHEYYGLESYEAIQSAINLLLEDITIHTVILHCDSPGGDAHLCGETYDMLSVLADNKETVIAHAEGDMTSAMYWLASAFPIITCTKYSSVGSIGGYSIYASRKRMLKDQGLDLVVARTASKKGILNGVESISAITKEILTELVENAVEPFIASVKDSRPSLAGDWGDGRTFKPSVAKEFGLIDSVISTHELITKVSTL